ncbi:hypothetical protein DEO72_LG4g1506 [Vigna unguiculata]|uniref:Uncharacterized protein n=1 Tax=Vigna unguiculata TaxID=3917 RepID=A0A4D6LPV6_VIGUN|nr:hypothetical protein DEO72_LG4g1506 [Vigna unguiculata]
MLALMVDTSAHPRVARPRAMCYKCFNESISFTTRVSGCNPYLESLSNPYLVIQMGHHHRHPLTWAMELRPDHWSATLKVSPRDPKELCTNTNKT